MLNKPQTLKPRVVKAQRRAAGDPVATAKGGLALAQALANRLRLWSDVARLVPKRKDPTPGFPVVAVLCALIHGLLSGGRGFSATEPLRGDEPLLKLPGLSAAPSAETVEEVIKHLAEKSGAASLNRLLRRLSAAILRAVLIRQWRSHLKRKSSLKFHNHGMCGSTFSRSRVWGRPS